MDPTNKRDIVVIGASAGGFDVLKQIIASLPIDFQAAVFIVWHISPDVRGILPEVLNRLGALRTSHAVDNEPIESGRVYIAPPDHHLLLEQGRMRLTRGPKENRFRPAVDPLFRSAAFAFGPRVIGVILSGALDDGTAGLWAVKQFGGIAIVQDPNDADVPSMPQHAIRSVKVDHKVPARDIADLLKKLVTEDVPQKNGISEEEARKVELETRIAMGEKINKEGFVESGELTPYTCPECHGVLASIREGQRIRFRCHTGHAFSADSLLSAVTENIEESMWSAIRSIRESVIFLNHMGDHFAEENDPKLAALYFRKAKEAERRADVLKQTVMGHEQLSTQKIEHQARESA
jgi:two-component system, chemotaxis family, protein-glutamate methylesterase/glutaminase